MSASARNYVYELKVKDPKKKEPTLSKERLAECKKSVAKYLTDSNGNKA